MSLWRTGRFLKSCVDVAQLPAQTCPELAFLGRTNVGKSSLIGALFHQPTLVRTSRQHGSTKMLNVFAAGNLKRPQTPSLFVVDTPGYGIGSTKEQMHLLGDYVSARRDKLLCLLLVDASHGLKPIDRYVLDLLHELEANHQIVLTKADKIGLAKLRKVGGALEASSCPQCADLRACSVKLRQGIEGMQKHVTKQFRLKL
eukprot:m.116308 g.116308  ORF g.116308 m.116308 type:complete len:200 (-) comp16375_c0_seq12:136-735(-)